MEETKSIGRIDMVMGLFLDSMTTGYLKQIVNNEHIEDSLKKDNKQKMVAGMLSFLPQEQCLLPHQRHAQSDQKLKHRKIS